MPLIVLAVAMGAVLATSCVGKQIAAPQPPRSDLIVLLRDEDTGNLGRASVSTRFGSVTLDSERQVTRVQPNQPPSLVDVMSDTEVVESFGDVLAALPLPTLRFTLQFRFDSVELTDEAHHLALEIVDTVSERPFPEVTVVGHADAVGPEDVNFALGMKRANRLRALFLDAGLDPNSISVSSRGENDLRIQTDEATPEARNRRVEIVIR